MIRGRRKAAARKKTAAIFRRCRNAQRAFLFSFALEFPALYQAILLFYSYRRAVRDAPRVLAIRGDGDGYIMQREFPSLHARARARAEPPDAAATELAY